jgi:hypothetical protein
MFLLGNNLVFHSNALGLLKKCHWYQKKILGHKKETSRKSKGGVQIKQDLPHQAAFALKR